MMNQNRRTFFSTLTALLIGGGTVAIGAMVTPHMESYNWKTWVRRNIQVLDRRTRSADIQFPANWTLDELQAACDYLNMQYGWLVTSLRMGPDDGRRFARLCPSGDVMAYTRAFPPGLIRFYCSPKRQA